MRLSKITNKIRTAKGLTLVEFLISLIIMVIILGVITMTLIIDIDQFKFRKEKIVSFMSEWTAAEHLKDRIPKASYLNITDPIIGDPYNKGRGIILYNRDKNIIGTYAGTGNDIFYTGTTSGQTKTFKNVKATFRPIAPVGSLDVKEVRLDFTSPFASILYLVCNVDAFCMECRKDSPGGSGDGSAMKTLYRFPTWARVYKCDDKHGYAEDIKQVTDQLGNPDGFILTGYRSYGGSSPQSSFSLIKIDDFGNVEWKTAANVTGLESYVYGGSATKSAAGENLGYVCVGAVGVKLSDKATMALLKVDPNGVPNWLKKYSIATGNNQTSYGISVETTTDAAGGSTGYAIFGWVNPSKGNPDTEKACIVKTDLNGAQLWSKTFAGASQTAGFDLFHFGRELETAGGLPDGFIACGYSTISHPLYVVRTDNSGNQLWSRLITPTGSDSTEIEPTYDSFGSLDGFIMTSTSGYYYVEAIRLNSNGIPQWAVYFSPGKTGTRGRSVKQVFDENNDPDGYIIGGDTSYYGVGGSYDMYLIKLTNSGQREWIRTFGGNSTEACFALLPLRYADQPSGYILAGMGWSFSPCQSFYVVRTDPNGKCPEASSPTVIDVNCASVAFAQVEAGAVSTRGDDSVPVSYSVTATELSAAPD